MATVALLSGTVALSQVARHLHLRATPRPTHLPPGGVHLARRHGVAQRVRYPSATKDAARFSRVARVAVSVEEDLERPVRQSSATTSLRFAQLARAVAPWSPFGAALLRDGVWIAAFAPIAATALPAAAAVLALLAVALGHGQVDLSAPLLLVAAALAIFDGAAGALVAMVVVPTAVLGSAMPLGFALGVAVLLGATYAATGAMCNYFRPLLRSGPDPLPYWWRRAGDLAIAGGLTAFLVYEFALMAMGFSTTGSEALVGSPSLLALVATLAMVLRYLFADLAMARRGPALEHLLGVKLEARPWRREVATAVGKAVIVVAISEAIFSRWWVALALGCCYLANQLLPRLAADRRLELPGGRFWPRNLVKVGCLSVLAMVLQPALTALGLTPMVAISISLIVVLALAAMADVATAEHPVTPTASWGQSLLGLLAVLGTAAVLGTSV